jgi:hypothetical protein
MLKGLFEIKDDADKQINAIVHKFLCALDAAGEYAPTVTTRFGGSDSIEEISLLGDEVSIAYQRCYRGCLDSDAMRYPIELVENANLGEIAAFVEELTRRKSEELALKQKVDQQATRERELKLLEKLRQKYDGLE